MFPTVITKYIYNKLTVIIQYATLGVSKQYLNNLHYN